MLALYNNIWWCTDVASAELESCFTIKLSKYLLELGARGVLAEHISEYLRKMAVTLTLQALALLYHCIGELEGS